MPAASTPRWIVRNVGTGLWVLTEEKTDNPRSVWATTDILNTFSPQQLVFRIVSDSERELFARQPARPTYSSFLNSCPRPPNMDVR